MTGLSGIQSVRQMRARGKTTASRFLHSDLQHAPNSTIFRNFQVPIQSLLYYRDRCLGVNRTRVWCHCVQFLLLGYPPGPPAPLPYPATSSTYLFFPTSGRFQTGKYKPPQVVSHNALNTMFIPIARQRQMCLFYPPWRRRLLCSSFSGGGKVQNEGKVWREQWKKSDKETLSCWWLDKRLNWSRVRFWLAFFNNCFQGVHWSFGVDKEPVRVPRLSGTRETEDGKETSGRWMWERVQGGNCGELLDSNVPLTIRQSCQPDV